jgi:putative oxidoreductase
MIRIIRSSSAPFHAILRIVSGLLFAMHGAQKLFNFPPGPGKVPLAGLMGLAGVIELVGGLMIAFGFLVGIAAFIASGEMAVAYFKAHFPSGVFPIQNHGEPAVLFCFIFLYFAVAGAGIWSIDGAVSRHPDHISS